MADPPAPQMQTTGPHPALRHPVDQVPAAGTSALRKVSLRLASGRSERPTPLRQLARRIGVGLALADIAVVMAGLLASPTFDQVLHPQILALAIVCLTLPVAVGIAAGGGYREDLVLRQGRTSLAALGALVGASIGLVLSKLVLLWGAGDAGALRFGMRSLALPLVLTLWVLVSRRLLRLALRHLTRGWTVVVLGDAADAARLQQALTRNGLGDTCVALPPGNPVCALQLVEAARERLRAIVIPGTRDDLPVAVRLGLVHANLLGARILREVDLIEEVEERIPVLAVDTWWLIERELQPGAVSAGEQVFKRSLDLLVAVPLLVALLPVLLATAVAVRLTSRGPALFTQIREGLGRRPFTIYKFRTMRIDAEAGGARWATANDPRVTPIGGFLRKSRLDELPQLWNVIRGDMSLVGPRPERPEFNRMLCDRIPWYDLRHLARPGLTGWAQVRYPYGASVEDAIAKLEYDIYYLRHASPAFDLRILVRTIAVVLGLRGR
jgi:exopolysaccharide biosynthesis polyprenyl glycosylphosphotransferase